MGSFEPMNCLNLIYCYTQRKEFRVQNSLVIYLNVICTTLYTVSSNLFRIDLKQMKNILLQIPNIRGGSLHNLGEGEIWKPFTAKIEQKERKKQFVQEIISNKTNATTMAAVSNKYVVRNKRKCIIDIFFVHFNLTLTL